MLKLKLVTAVAVLLATGQAYSSSQSIHGIWMRGDGNARVRIAACGPSLCATNVWIRDTSGGEEVGDRLVMTVAPDDRGRLAGTAFDPKRDLTYSIRIDIGETGLVTRGCILGGLLCRSIDWSRAGN
ncbi:MAG TPA: DUF2147 domain-containing protein [Rhizobiales bacterium]|nr:DUF2147 domain-containing protein [Hyphomicrobiales bacterium]